MTLTPAQAVAQVDSPRHDWDELSDQYRRHCREIAAAAIAAHKVLEADVPLAQPEYMPPAADEWAEYYAPPAPSFHAERDGTLGEVEVGDRVMHEGVWREAEGARPCMDFGMKLHVIFTDQAWMCADAALTVRIQKRATNTEGPPAEMRLPGGDVAYQTVRAGEVVVGMWVERFDEWYQITEARAIRTLGLCELTYKTDHGQARWSCDPDTKVKVASTVDGARLAAERKAMQAEAYDTACEART